MIINVIFVVLTYCMTVCFSYFFSKSKRYGFYQSIFGSTFVVFLFTFLKFSLNWNYIWALVLPIVIYATTLMIVKYIVKRNT